VSSKDSAQTQGTAPDRCARDGAPCYVGAGTDDAHYRCGTSACGVVDLGQARKRKSDREDARHFANIVKLCEHIKPRLS
jgi:trimethylamine:corrinoid methyltransferase-like protein